MDNLRDPGSLLLLLVRLLLGRLFRVRLEPRVGRIDHPLDGRKLSRLLGFSHGKGFVVGGEVKEAGGEGIGW
jgi:hypothetical protein